MIESISNYLNHHSAQYLEVNLMEGAAHAEQMHDLGQRRPRMRIVSDDELFLYQ
jgi:hypothetical protein